MKAKKELAESLCKCVGISFDRLVSLSIEIPLKEAIRVKAEYLSLNSTSDLSHVSKQWELIEVVPGDDG